MFQGAVIRKIADGSRAYGVELRTFSFSYVASRVEIQNYTLNLEAKILSKTPTVSGPEHAQEIQKC